MSEAKKIIGRRTIHEQAVHHWGGDFACGTSILPSPSEVRQMRQGGNDQAGRRIIDIIAQADINDKWLIESTARMPLDKIYGRLEKGTEYGYLDFLTQNFPDLLEKIKTKYGSIPLVKRSPYVDVFADEDAHHLINTISRLIPEEVYEIYLVDRESDAMVHFLERNFPQILEEIKVKYKILPVVKAAAVHQSTASP